MLRDTHARAHNAIVTERVGPLRWRASAAGWVAYGCTPWTARLKIRLEYGLS